MISVSCSEVVLNLLQVPVNNTNIILPAHRMSVLCYDNILRLRCWTRHLDLVIGEGLHGDEGGVAGARLAALN